MSISRFVPKLLHIGEWEWDNWLGAVGAASLVIGLIVFGVVHFGDKLNRQEQQSQPEVSASNADKCGPADPGAPIIADMLLDEWKRGQSGAHLWAASHKDVPVYYLTNWERLPGAYASGTGGEKVVKPDSSRWRYRILDTKGLTRTVVVSVGRSAENICEVDSLTEAE